ncbi:MAG TPA: sterol desaturase family protein [Bacteroidota bacterium]|nr:sterol desaturase family protein [Bacteroidota bacterium]
MPIELTSPVIVVLSAAILVVLERNYPYEPKQSFLRSGFVNDLAFYAILQSYILGYIIFFFAKWLDRQSGLSQLHLVSDWPIGWQFFVFFVIHDFYIYWFHRLQHSSKYLWRIHEAHHSSLDVDWLSGARSHSLEILINQTVEFAPLILCGASPAVILYKGVVDSVWGMYIHSNIDVHSGPLQYLINGPEMHRWHHAQEVTEGGINFSTKLALWDWLFGTAHLPRPEKPKGYGLEGVKFPGNYVAQHIFAFRSFEPPVPRHSEPTTASVGIDETTITV